MRLYSNQYIKNWFSLFKKGLLLGCSCDYSSCSTPAAFLHPILPLHVKNLPQVCKLSSTFPGDYLLAIRMVRDGLPREYSHSWHQQGCTLCRASAEHVFLPTTWWLSLVKEQRRPKKPQAHTSPLQETRIKLGWSVPTHPSKCNPEPFRTLFTGSLLVWQYHLFVFRICHPLAEGLDSKRECW